MIPRWWAASARTGIRRVSGRMTRSRTVTPTPRLTIPRGCPPGESRRRVLRQHQRSVALGVVAEHLRADAGRCGVAVADDGSRLVHVSPTAEPATPREVRVLVVQEQALVEEPDVVEVGTRQQDRATAPGEHLRRLVVLALVALEEPAIAAEPIGVQARPGVVDHVELVVVEADLHPRRILFGERHIRRVDLGAHRDVALGRARRRAPPGGTAMRPSPGRTRRRARRHDHRAISSPSSRRGSSAGKKPSSKAIRSSARTPSTRAAVRRTPRVRGSRPSWRASGTVNWRLHVALGEDDLRARRADPAAARRAPRRVAAASPSPRWRRC